MASRKEKICSEGSPSLQTFCWGAARQGPVTIDAVTQILQVRTRSPTETAHNPRPTQ